MKIAILLFGNRVSPRFDCAPALLFITTNSRQEIIERSKQSIQNSHYLEIITRLQEAAADVVICGSIAKEMQLMLEENGTEVIPWVSGEARKALHLFLRGQLFPGTVVCPGRRTCRLGFCAQGRHGKGRSK